ncbi:hypothetical protein DTV83_24950, partial [Salmonella enterica subsp. enterica serovar Typhimurium]|nr:hypothetical protein [Salmonella enterica subsp. enterica serovar Typhimurium]
AVSGSFTGEINATSGKFSGVIEAREFVGDICGSKVMQGVSIRATNAAPQHGIPTAPPIR